MPEPVIATRDLTKRYGDTVAVDRLTLTVHEGEVFGLLGPNGAGKTTTILMLLGLTEPTSGSVRVLGRDPAREPLAVKRLVGYMPDAVGFYEDLTAEENLLYTAELNGVPRAEALRRIEARLAEVGLAHVRHAKVGTFSRGMRQRLGIADALVKDPRVLILDEPTTAIDPEGVRDMLRLIRNLARERGLTVLVSSHLLHQVQEICDRVGIFVKGRLVAEGPIEALAEQLFKDEPVRVEVRLAAGGAEREGSVAPRTPDAPGAPDRPLAPDSLDAAVSLGPDPRAVLERLSFVRRVVPGRDGRTWVAECAPEAGTDAAPRLARAIVEAGLPLEGMRTQGRGLDDIYLRYFQRARGEDGGSGGEARRGDAREGGAPGTGGAGAGPSTARTEVRA